MKKISFMLFGLFWFSNYAQIENRLVPLEAEKSFEDFSDGNSFVLNQKELEEKYSNNYNLYTAIKSQFLNLHNGSSEVVQLIVIDLEHIQVFESKETNTITYKVDIAGQELDEEAEPLIVYNLMHFTKDHKTYYFTLLRYDFSEIPYEKYILSPHEFTNVLTLIPLNDIGNIYENIAYSFAKELLVNNNLLSSSSQYYDKITAFANCAKTVEVAGVACESCGLHYGEVVDEKWCLHTDAKIGPKPRYTYMDLSDCEEKLIEKSKDLVYF